MKWGSKRTQIVQAPEPMPVVPTVFVYVAGRDTAVLTRRGTATNLARRNPLLRPGETIYCTDTDSFRWNNSDQPTRWDTLTDYTTQETA